MTGGKAPVPRYRTTRFLLVGPGPITTTSCSGKPASRKRRASSSACRWQQLSAAIAGRHHPGLPGVLEARSLQQDAPRGDGRPAAQQGAALPLGHPAPDAVLDLVAAVRQATGCALPVEHVAAKPGEADLANGKQMFLNKCGACHTLEDAGSNGTLGPNLDDAAVGDRIEGLKVSGFEALVRQQID